MADKSFEGNQKLKTDKFQFVERIDAILLVVFTPAYTPFGRSFALKKH